MITSSLIDHRLASQHIDTKPFASAGEVVNWMGAMQAQDYLGSLWAIGLRTKKCTEADIENAIADKKIVRTWPMRGTLHFVDAANVRWMLTHLTAHPRARATAQHKQEGLTAQEFKKSRNIIECVLQGNQLLTREEIYAALERNKIACKGQRGMHIIVQLAQEGLICLAKRKGKQHTFALLDEWIPKSKTLNKEEAYYTLALTYFSSHGPATLLDFAWWSGLSPQDARTAFHSAETKLKELKVADISYWMAKVSPSKAQSSLLLPPFDEYLIAYKDRSAMVEAAHAHHVRSSVNGLLSPIIVHQGKIVGTWKRVIKKDTVIITPRLFTKEKIHPAIIKAADRYAKFLGLTAQLE